MQNAKQAVKEFLHKGNHHTVDIDQETRPSVVHETVAQRQHENITTAVDREVHQHHHQTHVQPIKHNVEEAEQHHHNVVPIEHREHLSNKGAEVEQQLRDHHSQFRDEREVLPVETTNSARTVVGEHTHHHIHDVIQPVVERNTMQSHVVHTTVPVHEHIEHDAMVHKGNVLPTMSMDEFSRAGHSLTGSTKNPEHIEYEGEPLKIDGKSHVGFGGLTGQERGTNSGVGSNDYTTGSGTTGSGVSGTAGRLENDASNVPRSVDNNNNGTTGSGTTQKPSLLNKIMGSTST